MSFFLLIFSSIQSKPIYPYSQVFSIYFFEDWSILKMNSDYISYLLITIFFQTKATPYSICDFFIEPKL